MKLKKELRAVKEINEQVRRERDEQEKQKEKDKSKDNSTSSSTNSNGSVTHNSNNNNPLLSNGDHDTPPHPGVLHGGDMGGGGLTVDGKMLT